MMNFLLLSYFVDMNFHTSEHQFLLTQIRFQGFTTAMMTYYKRGFYNYFKNRENVLQTMRRFL